ncbi:bifunctional metallophosphatase/5'-nucleotidase [Oceanobacillus salinisoli]|uniref:bifunctional metallophosphatase/5'-nucleotidase n=1 Tax=Oceanobacillus salinisoli TaxID=2678611 RepID=UPI0012E30D7A|nr:5'-nucleotidase C-terminal domain-containing protein [Oceanobacillus salinisoli]
MKSKVLMIIFGSVVTLGIFSLVLAPSGLAAEKGREVNVLYFNDAHEISPVVNEYGNRGEVARLKTAIDMVKEENKHTVVTFGGDLGGGTLFGGVFKGFPMVEAFNKIPIDLASFGQHDFDFGSEVTEELVEQSDFQWISSNLTDTEGNPFADVPRYYVENLQGIKIGFIGLTDGMGTTTQDGKVIQQDIIESAQAAVDLLEENENTDIIIALTQQPQENNMALLDAVPEIDAILSEEMYEAKSTIYNHNGKYIMTPEGNMGSVIQLKVVKHKQDVTFFPEVIRVNGEVEEDPELKELEDYYEAKLSEMMDETIAELRTDLVYGENHESRFQETNIGNFIADSFMTYYNADIGFMNGGGIRSSVEAGDFTLRDAYSILPFGNKVMLVELTGETIAKALENGVSNVESLSGRFLQVSGISYTYDSRELVGERVQSILIDGAPIDFEQTYRVALPNFMYFGGDGYDMLADAEVMVDDNSARTDVEVLIEYVEELGVIEPFVEGRIQVLP